MRPLFRSGAIALVAAALAAAPGVARAQIRAVAGDPPCVRGTIALVDPVDSANAHAGDVFRFRLVDAETTADGVAVPAGNLGYGVVATVSHAQRGGIGGYVALEPRVFTLQDGTHVPVIADRLDDAAATARGSSRNIPGVFGAVPLAGWVLGPYGFLHHGADVTIPVGTRLAVLVGDDLALGKCRIPTLAETQPRRQAASPEAQPAPDPTATP